MTTRKLSPFIFILLFFSIGSFGQNRNDSLQMINNLLKQAKEYAQLIKNKDTLKFTDKIYPELITLIGGKDKLIAMTISGYKQLEKQGISIDSVVFFKPNPFIYVADVLQTTMTEVLIMTIPKGKMISKSTLIAISHDKGITWYFLDTSGWELNEINEKFPNLSRQLIIAPKEKPVAYKN